MSDKRRVFLLTALAIGLVGPCLAQTTTTTTQQNITIPTFTTTGFINPTDVTGWGGVLGDVRGRKQLEGPPDLSKFLFHGLAKSVESDPRYSFTGNWSYLDQIDQYVAKLQDKMPALATVSGELKTPCGAAPQSMPPVPDLPKPDQLAKKEAETAAKLNLPWKPISGGASAGSKIVFSRSVQAFTSGNIEPRVMVGTPGTTAVPRSDYDVALKVGRAYFSNPPGGAEFGVESGRVKVLIPAGSSVMVDTASNGITHISQTTGLQPSTIVDLCNTAIQLDKVATGDFVTIAPEDAVAQDLIAANGIDEKIDRISRDEGYLLVAGKFSVGDVLTKDPLIQTAPFQSVAVLKDQKVIMANHAQEHPWVKAKAPLVAQVQSSEQTMNPHRTTFMPTRGARYGRISDNELMVADGAVLVKGGDKPVIVSTEVNRQKVMTQIRAGAVVMISGLDGRATVLNLTDSGPGSCALLIPSGSNGKYKSVNVGMGQVAELYINDGMEPASTIVSYRTIDKQDLTNGVGLLLAQYDYLAAMKRFNLSFALPSNDLNKVLKTMAATAQLMQGRSSH
jgi:hypothetical protein